MLRKLKKTSMCDALGNLVPFTQFNKREKHPWMGVTFGKFADCIFTECNTLQRVFFTFFK